MHTREIRKLGDVSIHRIDEHKTLYFKSDKDRVGKVMAYGVIGHNRVWFIVSDGSFPRLYVERRKLDFVIRENEDVAEYNLCGIMAHGGCTFEGEMCNLGISLPDMIPQKYLYAFNYRRFWGFDYGHFGDYVMGRDVPSPIPLRKWTVNEILGDLAFANLDEGWHL